MIDYLASHDPVHQVLALGTLCLSVFVVLTHNFARKEIKALARDLRDLQRVEPELYIHCIVCDETVIVPLPQFSRVTTNLSTPRLRPHPIVCDSCRRGIMAFRSIVFDENDKNQ